MRQKRSGLQAAAAGIGLLFLILNSNLAFDAARDGVELCIKTVIPALFPFFVISMVLTGSCMGCNCYPLSALAKALGIPEPATSILIPAFLGGYPVGAKCVGDFFQDRQITKEEAERLLAFCSNAGPSFLFGIVSVFFAEGTWIWLLWLIHILSAVLTAASIPSVDSLSPEKTRKRKEKDQIIVSSAKAMCMVCCWVLLFRVITAFLNAWCFRIFPQWLQVLTTGLLELTNGCWELQKIVDVEYRFLICSCMLSFGGICVILQTASVTRGLQIKYYVFGKILQTIFSFLLSMTIIGKQGVIFAAAIPILVIILRKKQIKYRNPAPVPV